MAFKAILIGGVVANVASNLVEDEHWPVFQKFMDEHGRSYPGKLEMVERFEIFKSNLKLIQERNSKGGAQHGINKFADLSPAEFRDRYLGRLPLDSTILRETSRTFTASNSLSTSINWCDKGHCTPVKDQGQCGSCWAFGGVESLESVYSIQVGGLYTLSTEQVVACDTNDGGCKGGNAVNAWAYANSVGGIEPASDWKYEITSPMVTPTCIKSKVVPADFKVSADAYYWVSGGNSQQNETNMVSALQELTLSVAVEADVWQTYTGGVITAADGCGTALDHNVQITGYNAAGNYWIVRNSWGAAWGNAGFVYVEAGKNVCGIAMECAAPETCTPGSCTGHQPDVQV